MTDPSITRADARHADRIARENRRQALNHAVRLSNGLDPDSTLEAATRFARFLDDGEERRDAGTADRGPSEGDGLTPNQMVDDFIGRVVAQGGVIAADPSWPEVGRDARAAAQEAQKAEPVPDPFGPIEHSPWDAGTDAAEASADYWPPLRIRMDDGSVEEVSIQKPPMPDVLRSALADESIPDEMTYTWLGTPVEGLNQSVIDLIDAALRWRRHAAALRWRRHAPAAVVGPYATALAQAIDKLDPTAPVTEQHGATERPIRASVHSTRRDIVRLTPEGEASCFRSVIVVVPVDCARLTGPDLATRIADLINGDA